MAVTTNPGNPLDLILGGRTLIVGVEDDAADPNLLRVYVGARYKGIYFTLADVEDKEQVRSAWAGGGHLYMPIDSLPPLLEDQPDQQGEES